MNLYQLAQQVTDEVLGKGAYVKANHFDPSKGETYAGQQKRKPKAKKRKTKRNS